MGAHSVAGEDPHGTVCSLEGTLEAYLWPSATQKLDRSVLLHQMNWQKGKGNWQKEQKEGKGTRAEEADKGEEHLLADLPSACYKYKCRFYLLINIQRYPVILGHFLFRTTLKLIWLKLNGTSFSVHSQY